MNNINGGLECPAYHGGWHGEAVKMRLNRYCKASSALGLETILLLDGCKLLNTSFAECLEDGTCPECEKFSDGTEPLVSESFDDVSDASTNTSPIDAEDISDATPGPNPSPTPESVESEEQDTASPSSIVPAETDTTSPTKTDNISDAFPDPNPSPAPESVKSEEEQTPSPSSIIPAETDTTTPTETENISDATPYTNPSPAPEPVESEKEQTPSPTIAVPAQTEATSVTSSPQNEDVQADESSSSSCPEGLFSVDGLPDCCVPEPLYHGDGACDPYAPLNTAECAFDGGDCCHETCDSDSTYACSTVPSDYGPFGFYCINPTVKEYIDSELCTVSDRIKIGDGRCDSGNEMYNSEACNWDGGDW